MQKIREFGITNLILVIILALGLVLRVVNLDISPPGFNADEASLGYNAYSLIKTGKDEWGESFPLVFKSFSDYKPGLYVYLAVPFIATLGLNEFATRLPSILLGVLTIYLIFLISKRITNNNYIAISSAFLLAISPWHIHYSRGAWETNVATFFISFGVLAFIAGLKNHKWFYLSGIAFVLSMYAYQSPRLVIPILVLTLSVAYFRQVKIKKIIGPLILGLVFILPLIYLIFANKGLSRFQGVSIFTDIGPGIRINEDRGEHDNPNDLMGKIYHNKLTAYGLNFTNHYLDHFTPLFLFTAGDPLGRNKAPEVGQLYLFELITVILGIFYLIKKGFKDSKIIYFWLLVAPIAASLTYQTPHALRAHNMVIPLTLISGAGLGFVLEQLKEAKKYMFFTLTALSVFIIGFFVIKYLHQYYIHLPKQYALEWEYGFSQMVPFVFENKDFFKKVVITDKYDQAYILMLFYSKYDPQEYQKTAKPTGVDKYGFSTITSFDNFEFRPIGSEEIGRQDGILYIGTDFEIPDDGKKYLKVIKYPNGKPVFKIIGT